MEILEQQNEGLFQESLAKIGALTLIIEHKDKQIEYLQKMLEISKKELKWESAVCDEYEQHVREFESLGKDYHSSFSN